MTRELSDLIFYAAPATLTASRNYFTLWNPASSERSIILDTLKAIKNGTVALTGVLSAQLFLTRITTQAPSGGTEANSGFTSLTGNGVCGIRAPGQSLPGGISFMVLPTANVTAGEVLSERQLFPEETATVNYDAIEFLDSPIIIPPGTGIRVVQGATGSAVGSVSFKGEITISSVGLWKV